MAIDISHTCPKSRFIDFSYSVRIVNKSSQIRISTTDITGELDVYGENSVVLL